MCGCTCMYINKYIYINIIYYIKEIKIYKLIYINRREKEYIVYVYRTGASEHTFTIRLEGGYVATV